jgi:hypothetical protein
MPYQNINATVSTADAQTIRDAIATIREKLPFLVALTADERKKMVKAGPDSVSFINNASTAAQNNPAILPASFNTEEFQNDVELFTIMTELCTLALSLFSQMDDTRLAVGSETMQEAITVYNYFKAAVKTTPGLKPIVDQLGERFLKASRSKEPPKSNS